MQLLLLLLKRTGISKVRYLVETMISSNEMIFMVVYGI